MKIPLPLKIVALVQFLILFLLGLDEIGFGIPVARQVVGFIYVTFIPGYLLLTILRSRNSDPMVAVLYSVGLSIAFLMFVGLAVNELFPLLGISNPISALPLIITLSIIVSILWVSNYKRKANSSDLCTVNVAGLLSLPTIFLLSIPCVSILGIILQVYYGNNIGLLLVVVLISIVAVLIGIGKFISKKLYPLAILVIALALLLQYPNMSSFLTGYDVNSEYYYSSLAIANSHWNPMIPANINGMLSIVMFSPIYSVVLGMNNALVFKIVYPLLFSLVPLALFCAFRKLSNEKTAFLGSFFFMSFPTFFTEMTSVTRQQIAELFFALLILLLVEQNMKPSVRSLLACAFVAGLITSHYGLSHIFLVFYLVLSAVLLFLIKSSVLGRIGQYFHGKPQEQALASGDSQRARIVNGTFILFSFVIAFAWYTYVSSSNILETVVYIGQHFWNGIFASFFDPTTRGFPAQGLFGGPAVSTSPLREVNQILQYFTLLFMVVGVLVLIKGEGRIRRNNEFFVWTIASTVLLGLSVVLPYFASTLNASRVYEIALLFLSLCGASGGMFFLGKIMKMFHLNTKRVSLILAVVLVSYLMFSTGFVYEIARDTPSSAILGLQRLKTSTGQVAVWFNSIYIWPDEVASAQWLSKYRWATYEVFADVERGQRVLVSYGMIPMEDSKLFSNYMEIPSHAYLYLGHLNVVDGLFTYVNMSSGTLDASNISEISPTLERCNVIYSNGGSELLMSTP